MRWIFLSAVLASTAPLAPVHASTEPTPESCRIELAGGQASAPPLPFEILARDPVERLRAVAEAVLAESREIYEEIDQFPIGSRLRIEASGRPRLRQVELDHIRRGILRARELFETIARLSVPLRSETDYRLEFIDSYLKSLPPIEQFIVTGRRPFAEELPTRIVTHTSRAFLSYSYFGLQTSLNLQGFIRAVRAFPDIFSSPQIQSLLQEYVVDGLEFSVAQNVEAFGHPLGWSSEHFLDLSSVLTASGPEKRPLQNQYDQNSDRVLVMANQQLLETLLGEIITNARLASQRRSGERTAVTRVKRHASGTVDVEVEDFGHANEYDDVRGFGVSHAATHGTGMGRFRIEILRQFMGYQLIREIKPDGSGSIMKLRIPSEHVMTDFSDHD